MPTTDADVVIVGAGPGGAAAAVALAQRGVTNVILLDRDEFPRDKTCGSGISPMGLAVADELGIGSEVRRLGYRIHSLRIITAAHKEMLLSSDATAMILLRKYFDNLLVDRAKALGVKFRGHFLAKELIREGEQVVGVRARDGAEVRGRYVLCADGAHSIFSADPRPRHSISTLMGWWEGFPFRPNTIDMVFAKSVAPLYGWMFPEGSDRVNIGICIDGEDAQGNKTQRNVRDVFQQFLDDHYKSELSRARQVGRLKGHPISYTTWVGHCTAPGALYLGEAARVTHNMTGEGIFQAMQSGVYAAEAVSNVLFGHATEQAAWKRYVWAHRKRFTASFVMGHVLRRAIDSTLLDHVADVYNNPTVREVVTRAVAFSMVGKNAGHAAPRTAADEAAAAAPRDEVAVTATGGTA